jgi:hypothetical protein
VVGIDTRLIENEGEFGEKIICGRAPCELARVSPDTVTTRQWKKHGEFLFSYVKGGRAGTRDGKVGRGGVRNVVDSEQKSESEAPALRTRRHDCTALQVKSRYVLGVGGGSRTGRTAGRPRT